MNKLKIPGTHDEDDACDLVLKLSSVGYYTTLTLSGCGFQVDHGLHMRDMIRVRNWLDDAIKESAAMRKKEDRSHDRQTLLPPPRCR